MVLQESRCRHVDILSDQAEVTGLETWELP